MMKPVARTGFEPVSPPWKGGVLALRRTRLLNLSNSRYYTGFWDGKDNRWHLLPQIILNVLSCPTNPINPKNPSPFLS